MNKLVPHDACFSTVCFSIGISTFVHKRESSSLQVMKQLFKVSVAELDVAAKSDSIYEYCATNPYQEEYEDTTRLRTRSFKVGSK